MASLSFAIKWTGAAIGCLVVGGVAGWYCPTINTPSPLAMFAVWL